MADQYARTRLILGDEGVEKLRNARVILFGLGGVGGYAAEALARAGIGHIDLVDDDVFSLTNLNRQILATHSNIGKPKVEVAAQRIRDIDPTIEVETFQTFYLPDTANQFDFTRYDYVLDAIDTVTGKLDLIQQAKAAGTQVISCMGTGNKLDATAFRVADISKTSGCALARIMRKECSKRSIKGVKVVYSQELPTDAETCTEPQREGSSRRATPAPCLMFPAWRASLWQGKSSKISPMHPQVDPADAFLLHIFTSPSTFLLCNYTNFTHQIGYIPRYPAILYASFGLPHN